MKNRLLSLMVLCVALPAVLVANPGEKKTLTGVWFMQVTPHDAPRIILGLATFGGDGTFTNVGDQKLPAIPVIEAVGTELGPGYGRWTRTADREYHLTFYATLRKQGVVTGFHRVQSTIVLAESGEAFTAHGEADFLDANWNVVLSTTTDGKGKRLETPDQL
ncbi:MAG TPA: hypothetical protein VGD78_22595 [Chthoniobacterales bacterium]